MNKKPNKKAEAMSESSQVRRESMLDYLPPWEFCSTDEMVRAKTNVDTIVGDHPEKAETWRDIGVVYLGMDKVELAMLAFYKAVTLRDDYAEAWDFLAMRFVENEQFTLAAAAYKKAAQADPQSTRAWEGLAQAYAALKRPTETQVALEKLRQLDLAGAEDLEPTLRKSLAR